MRNQRAEKYRNEVKKANTGMNRLGKGQHDRAILIEAIRVIQLWGQKALLMKSLREDMVAEVRRIDGKCTAVLKQINAKT